MNGVEVGFRLPPEPLHLMKHTRVSFFPQKGKNMMNFFGLSFDWAHVVLVGLFALALAMYLAAARVTRKLTRRLSAAREEVASLGRLIDRMNDDRAFAQFMTVPAVGHGGSLPMETVDQTTAQPELPGVSTETPAPTPEAAIDLPLTDKTSISRSVRGDASEAVPGPTKPRVVDSVDDVTFGRIAKMVRDS
jgi:hypothetical protein